MNNKFIKYLVVVVIIFSNHSFGKEFNDLFTIYEPIQESSQIEKSINSAFNNMVYRLSGSSSPSNVWKIINSGSKRKDFITSYSIKKIDDKSYLEVIFNQDKFINQLDILSIPIINYSRPVLLFLIEIDSGLQQPYYLSYNSKLKTIDKVFVESLKKFSSSRGLFLELPIFDLEDSNDLATSTILSNPVNRISSKYNFDMLVKIKLTKSHCVIHGNGLNGYNYKKKLTLNAGNSGTLGRLILGLLTHSRSKIKIIGDNSLSKRDFKRVTEPLKKFGVNFTMKSNTLPITIEGTKNPKPIKEV